MTEQLFSKKLSYVRFDLEIWRCGETREEYAIAQTPADARAAAKAAIIQELWGLPFSENLEPSDYIQQQRIVKHCVYLFSPAGNINFLSFLNWSA